ncbi:MAG: hypothetical protein IPG17_25425 [Sandaracinaceae bacterium]|jgi:hypothetical protein|nr:hypothetical protein [Sandaracinaceae bacterium]MBK6811097.1 hypothetical protein [Sandaracinaceae bacterium]MBK7155872.1 hypothetical protein [Sandaracinaceae bacterium]MBK8407986.1 hypothetical protein [Sandaracinaceae bacterium]MBP7684041.1 hypothetical protein [Deltaproteobacteria bacterium]
MAGGGGGTTWVKILGLGLALLTLAHGLVVAQVELGFGHPALLAVGGLMVVFGSCEAMILCVEGIAQRMRWNPFVAGTMAGLAANVPELIMLGFVLAAKPRLGFIVVAMTLHVGAMAFGLYSGLLPRDASGHARLPEPLVKLSTDQFAGAGGAYLATGLIMLMLHTFSAGSHGGQGLGPVDLYTIGGLLLLVQVVGIVELVRRFGGTAKDEEWVGSVAEAEVAAEAPVPLRRILGFGALGLTTSVIGGHAVGDFADALVVRLAEAGYSEMVGALVLSVFACAGGYIMIASAHVRGMYDLALANVSGAITQNAVMVMPVALILLAIFGQLGVIPLLPSGAILPIDLETTSVVLLMFPPLLILWKAVKDDGRVSWVETASMVAVFGLTLYFLAEHG